MSQAAGQLHSTLDCAANQEDNLVNLYGGVRNVIPSFWARVGSEPQISIRSNRLSCGPSTVANKQGRTDMKHCKPTNEGNTCWTDQRRSVL